ncbi:alpha-D-ribose 1-methylphosphonate 5-triphosphate diphosphatase [Cypionkella sp.]|uniref:alpha-D-ribose 1-methylphosphonate 5-triphosphate diphosphatase n=1 Tax=Cypionkella sp. TaxID=2811411 RepID=UPI002721A673|nr:alpha-D-ribose 1-methylphosphonate 5-triphosphate diphosphatase [Cypionkella sp.]MDO8985930.1 alpha-D-ribose 1-methylphosphonate 5-triphosphate diphosphatase [Cypionkella sp.]MDP1575197.1 alpha-D-ribose 1-methylphosphonate 5-triphosphate diphosphatase [Cypionkella sp.]MDP2049913.1 alpha-D-ribose 1-methylphosphonate 5-triphosphate diphosphatase [Cypionkella sp.]
MEPFVIEGASVVLPDRIARVSVRVEGGVIAALDGPQDGARVIDGRGMTLAPALVDIHGDAFERQLMPRPGVMISTEAALLETDRQLAANGIATAYHALTLSWEPGLRSVAIGQEVMGTLAALAPRLTVENRVQLRWETFCFEALPLIEAALAGPLLPALAYNDHTTMGVLHPSVALQDRPFDFASDFPVVDMDSPGFAAKMESRAKRSGMDIGDFIALMRQMWERRPEVPGIIAEAGRKAAAAGAPMLSHDDSQPETRDYYRSHGARISEFPMNMAVTRSAREAGDWIVFGAPNAARGGSHLGSPGAADMVAAGLCDILASDYYYPAMLAAVARLQADGIGQLSDLWKLVSANPAAALGLADRGEFAVGRRADLVLLEWPEGRTPVVRQCFVNGRAAYGAIAAG